VTALAAALAPSPAGSSFEISIVLADDTLLRSLNRRWREKDGPTNVLSFPAQDFSRGLTATAPIPGLAMPLGDVVLAFETVRREAVVQGKALGDHLAHLVVHGALHLLGFDHMTDEDASRMEGLERQALRVMGIADPYLLPSLLPRRAGEDPETLLGANAHD
jgi:probable rRNA maturation factor